MEQTQNISQNKNSVSTKKLILEIKDLHKTFGDNHVLNGFNLRLSEGENLVIMGKSGSGKSVMIKCLVGLMQPDSGSIMVMGKDITKLKQLEYLDLSANEIKSLPKDISNWKSIKTKSKKLSSLVKIRVTAKLRN